MSSNSRTAHAGRSFRATSTLDWRPETDLTLIPVNEKICSHMLVSESGRVGVIREGDSWPASQVKRVLKDG
jgi:hypothetical protein